MKIIGISLHDRGSTMKLTSFKVTNYRCINETDWVHLDDMTCIVGKNESGKTSLLKALWKFNPYREQPYRLEREWPRGRRKQKREDAKVVTCKFVFTAAEAAAIKKLDPGIGEVAHVTITKKYNGSRIFTFGPHDPANEHPREDIKAEIQRRVSNVDGASPHFCNQFKPALDSMLKDVDTAAKPAADAADSLEKMKGQLAEMRAPDKPQQKQDDQVVKRLHIQIDLLTGKFRGKTPWRKAVDWVDEHMPTFIYMDDYRTFTGSAQLDQVKARFDRQQQQDSDETIVMIMNQAGLDLAEEVKKAASDDREQRMLDMNDASQTLTRELTDRWSQKQYEVMFQADGHHLVMFVKDAGTPVLVPLEERSKGFQWFFSFDMMFMAETEGDFKNAIILLDEPGLHLHAAAQRDLLKRMRAYAQSNQLVYSTHLPFMVDSTQLNSIYVCEETEGGSKVHQNWGTAGNDARFTLQAALGLSWSQSLFVGQYNLVVEGVTDLWYLTAVSALFADAGRPTIDQDLVISPAGGASKVAYVGTLLKGQELDVCVLLDSDDEGRSAYEQLVHNWIVAERHALQLASVVGKPGKIVIEDLLGRDYFAEMSAEAYKKELGAKALKLKKSDKRPIVEQVAEALTKNGVQSFNKGRVAKLVLRDLAGKTLADLDPGVVADFETVICAINRVVDAWKANPAPQD